jgi:hypothetical protein
MKMPLFLCSVNAFIHKRACVFWTWALLSEAASSSASRLSRVTIFVSFVERMRMSSRSMHAKNQWE